MALGMVGVIAFGAGGVQRFVVLFVIRFLKQDVGADAGLFEAAIVLDGGGGNVYVDPSDGSRSCA